MSLRERMEIQPRVSKLISILIRRSISSITTSVSSRRLIFDARKELCQEQSAELYISYHRDACPLAVYACVLMVNKSAIVMIAK